MFNIELFVIFIQIFNIHDYYLTFTYLKTSGLKHLVNFEIGKF